MNINDNKSVNSNSMSLKSDVVASVDNEFEPKAITSSTIATTTTATTSTTTEKHSLDSLIHNDNEYKKRKTTRNQNIIRCYKKYDDANNKATFIQKNFPTRNYTGTVISKRQCEGEGEGCMCTVVYQNGSSEELTESEIMKLRVPQFMLTDTTRLIFDKHISTYLPRKSLV